MANEYVPPANNGQTAMRPLNHIILQSTSAPTSQEKTVTSSFTTQTVTPDSGYDFLSSVTVNAIPVTEVENEAGGLTVTIG